MSFSSWLRNRNPFGAGKRARRTSIRPPAFRPRIDALEGRVVLSTLTVTSTLDSGPGSLRADIAAAHSGDTIVFDPSLAGQEVFLTSSDLYITTSLSIQGLPTKSAISGARSFSRVFSVATGVNVTLANLAIVDGQGRADINNFDDTSAGRGGGIANYGTLTLQSCTVSGNTASFFGGGIYNTGMLTVTGGTIVSGNSSGQGGGIANDAVGTLSVTGSTLSGNTAGYEGGGIFNAGKATASVTNSTLSGNKASYEGGGIFNAGKLEVSGCVLVSNTPDGIFGHYSNRKGNTFR